MNKIWSQQMIGWPPSIANCKALSHQASKALAASLISCAHTCLALPSPSDDTASQGVLACHQQHGTFHHDAISIIPCWGLPVALLRSNHSKGSHYSAAAQVRLRKPGAGLGSDAGEIAPGTGSSGSKKRGGDRARKRYTAIDTNLKARQTFHTIWCAEDRFRPP